MVGRGLVVRCVPRTANIGIYRNLVFRICTGGRVQRRIAPPLAKSFNGRHAAREFRHELVWTIGAMIVARIGRGCVLVATVTAVDCRICGNGGASCLSVPQRDLFHPFFTHIRSVGNNATHGQDRCGKNRQHRECTWKKTIGFHGDPPARAVETPALRPIRRQQKQASDPTPQTHEQMDVSTHNVTYTHIFGDFHTLK